MFWRLVFKKNLGPQHEENILGTSYEKVTILTDSFPKRQDLVEKYKDNKYKLINLSECDWEIPRGMNNQATVARYWLPELKEYEKYKQDQDLAPQALKDVGPSIPEPKPMLAQAPVIVYEPKKKIPKAKKVSIFSGIKKSSKPKNVSTLSAVKKRDNFRCTHIFNCKAHRDICVGIYGLPKIYTKPIL